MSNLGTERVLHVLLWNDTLFSVRTTRDPGLRFHNGHFVMIGLPVNGKPLLRAYSVASANHEEHLEFLSIKVPDGPLTSRLQHLKEGDEILVGRKPVGTLVVGDLKPGKHLYLLATGTGLAPFMSIIRDPETYERFEKVVLIHGVRLVSELAYADYIRHCFEEYNAHTDPSGRYFTLYKRWHLIGLEVGFSVASVVLRGEATGAATGWNADVVATAKRDLQPGELLDGEGGYTVWGKLLPAATSRRLGGLPLGLAHGVKLLRPVQQGRSLSWDDVAMDTGTRAYALRRELEGLFEAP
jgi:hypothetical protein